MLIRHAPADTQGAVTGRRDVGLLALEPAVLVGLGWMIGAVDRVVSSPARRCVDTARLLFPNASPQIDARLWEQDFGEWEGRDYSSLPDIGPLKGGDLACLRPPGGESFADVCERVRPAIRDLAEEGGRIAVVAHAGSVRAALALAFGGLPYPALAFEIAPLSVTMLRILPGDEVAVGYVNRTA